RRWKKDWPNEGLKFHIIDAPVCFPQIRQGLRRLTRQKMFEVDVGMARRCQPRYFRTREARQSANPVHWILGSEALLKRRLQQYNLVRCHPRNRGVVSESSVITRRLRFKGRLTSSHAT